MNRFKKLSITVAALAALAVGGAAFAGAQSSSTAPPAAVQQGMNEATAPGDTDGGQVGEQHESTSGEQNEPAGEHREAPDSASENDAPEGPNDHADSADSDKETHDD